MRAHFYSALHVLHSVFRGIYSNRLRVLAYHNVPDEDAFEKQVLYLKKNYSIIGMEDLLAYFQEKKVLSKNPLLITFDDGDITVLEKGLPILKRYQLKSCMFIITGLINTSTNVWIKRVEAKEMKEGKTFQQARSKVKQLKKISNEARIEIMKDYPQVSCRQLTTEDLKEMSKQGMYIGNHTHTHPMLDQCSPEEISEELEKSQIFFTQTGLKGFEIFAYPNGNENSETEKILKNFKVKLAFLFDHKVNKQKVSPLRISRIRVNSDTKLLEFKSKVAGAHPFIFNLKKSRI